MSVVGLRDLVDKHHVGGFIVSGLGVALAGLSLWYLLVIRAFHLNEFTATAGGGILAVLEIGLLAAFSIVLVYAGYWLVSSPFEMHRIWWAGLWTLIGLAGITVIVLVALAEQVLHGYSPPQPTLIQTMLLAAGGGALAGLLIGISTIQEATEAERVHRHQETLLFVNRLLRHNVLNGMQAIQGNAIVLEDHIDEAGDQPLATIQDQSDQIVDLVENVRALMTSLSAESSLQTVNLGTALQNAIESTQAAYPDAVMTADVSDNDNVVADELLEILFENVLQNAVTHNDTDEPRVTITTATREDTVRIAIADNGPGIPVEKREQLLDPGEQGEKSTGQGLGLYLVKKLLDRYGGTFSIEENEPRGTRVEIGLQRGDDVSLPD